VADDAEAVVVVLLLEVFLLRGDFVEVFCPRELEGPGPRALKPCVAADAVARDAFFEVLPEVVVVGCFVDGLLDDEGRSSVEVGNLEDWWHREAPAPELSAQSTFEACTPAVLYVAVLACGAFCPRGIAETLVGEIIPAAVDLVAEGVNGGVEFLVEVPLRGGRGPTVVCHSSSSSESV